MHQTQPTIQFIPSVRRGNGTGHLRRCLEMAAAINRNGSEDGGIAACVVIEDEPEALPTLGAMLQEFRHVPILRGEVAEGAEITILDSRQNPMKRAEVFKAKTTVVGFDEGGTARGYCDYLIDTLPAVAPRTAPNVYAPAARAPMAKRLQPVKDHRSIIVAFGGEDPAGLTPITCAELTENCGVDPERITAVRGPSAQEYDLPKGVTILHNPPDLRELLCGYDLIITSFGLTAYEALAAGISVLLVNPSVYHKKLSQSEGFIEAGVRKIHTATLRKVLEDPVDFSRIMTELKTKLESSRWVEETGELAGAGRIIQQLKKRRPSRCPICGGLPGKAVARFAGRTYFRCNLTGLVWLSLFDDERTAYDTSYFFSEYKAQYGKTYLEDFNNIKEMSRKRLQALRKFLPAGSTLIDVGCAYGPFLSAANDAGFRCSGIDIADSPVEYVRKELGIDSAVCDFLAFDSFSVFKRDTYDCLSMWYVIEHFDDLNAVLAKVAGLVKPGGIFAFSTPNAKGITGRLSLNRFLKASPRDHFTVWSPRTARATLKEFGFSVKKIRVAGHHPERFPHMSRKRAGMLYTLLMLLSRLLKLGDTFEVYAVRRSGREHAGG